MCTNGKRRTRHGANTESRGQALKTARTNVEWSKYKLRPRASQNREPHSTDDDRETLARHRERNWAKGTSNDRQRRNMEAAECRLPPIGRQTLEAHYTHIVV